MFDEDYGRDYGDENDYDDDDFFLDPEFWESENDEEDYEDDDYGSLVPNEPSPRNPSFSASLKIEKELVFS